jgi:hypothetical protein
MNERGSERKVQGRPVVSRKARAKTNRVGRAVPEIEQPSRKKHYSTAMFHPPFGEAVKVGKKRSTGRSSVCCSSAQKVILGSW